MRRVILGACVAVLTMMLAGCPSLNIGPRTFTSADVGGGGGFFGDVANTAEDGEAEPAGSGGGAERVVVEPDVIRREGNLLYVLNQFRGLSIVDLDTETLLVQVPTLGVPRDLYFADGVAYVLVGGARSVSVDTEAITSATSTRVYAVDVTDPAQAAIRSEQALDGDLVDSRMVGHILYVVAAEYRYGYYGDEAYVEASGTTTVTGIDVSNPAAMVVADEASFPGTGHVIHVNNEAAFVATSDWNSNLTSIVYLDITDPQGAIQEVGAMAVLGNVDDRFKLDAWNGTLRVVSSDWRGGNQVYVSTFDLADPALARLAEKRIEGAAGETLFATRFDGARAYVVTFLIVDPLFVLDLSDPVDPVVLGELEVPGYSTHIEARGDRLIALGVDNTDGRQVSMSIFDVSGSAAPTLVDRVSFGENWAWSSAYSDVKALAILDDVIIVPFSGWEGEMGGFDRLQFISYTSDSLDLRGSVDLSGSILRSFDYGESYFGVTTEQLSRIDASDLDNPAVVSSVTLAENVADFIPVSNNLSVELIARQDDGQLLARTVDGSQSVLGEVTLDAGYYQNAWVYNETLVIAGVVWDESPGYVVSLVDISDPGAPVVSETVAVAVDPYYAYYGFDIYGGGGFPEDGVAVKDAIAYPYYYGTVEESAFLLGNTLVLRCFSERFDRVIGGTEAYQGLASVNLDTAVWEETIGLGDPLIVSLNDRGNKLYLGTRESVGLQFLSPMTAYYIRELDILNGTEGPAVNVPGAFLDYDPQGDVLTLLDHQWESGGAYSTNMETVLWDGGNSVEPLDSLTLPSYSYNHQATSGRVYFESYEESAGLYQVTVSNSGDMTLGTPLVYGDTYGYLLDVIGDHALVNIGYGAIAHYTFDNGTGSLAELVEVSGYPATVRVGNGMVYLPLGYYGLVTLPL